MERELTSENFWAHIIALILAVVFAVSLVGFVSFVQWLQTATRFAG